MNNPRSPREEQPYGPTGNESIDSEPAGSPVVVAGILR